MKLSEELKKCVKSLINQEIIPNKVTKVFPITGGSVNRAFGIEAEKQSFFLKLNQKDRFPAMFLKEVKGLQLLAGCNSLRVPKVIYEGSTEDIAFLVLELVQEGTKCANYWEQLGEGLARIHQHSQPTFGLDYNNYNGSLIQLNNEKNNWNDFFIENRLETQLKLAIDAQRVDSEFIRLFQQAGQKFQHIFPEEKPALLHGDLWSGNFITNKNGVPMLIDPAVYYGNREVDLAMSMLFGGFHKRFYEAYHAIFPLEANWEKRVDVLNLYPLMVHVNLFGASYAQRVKSTLKKLV